MLVVMIARSEAVAGKRHIWIVLSSNGMIRMFSLSLIRAEESLGCCRVWISNPRRVDVGRGTLVELGRAFPRGGKTEEAPAIAITEDL
jgi:hypothetical protein